MHLVVEWFPKFKAKRFMKAQGFSSSLAFDFDQFSEVFTVFDNLHLMKIHQIWRQTFGNKANKRNCSTNHQSMSPRYLSGYQKSEFMFSFNTDSKTAAACTSKEWDRQP